MGIFGLLKFSVQYLSLLSTIMLVQSMVQYNSNCDTQRELTFREMRDILDKRLENVKLHNISLDRHRSAKDITFKVVVENIEPYVYINTTDNNTMSGYIFELWRILEDQLQFKSEYMHLESCAGKTALKVGTADIMLTPVVITGQDLDHYDHSMPVTSSWFEFYMKRKEGQASSVSYVTAWHPSLWYAFIVTLIVLTLFSWSIEFIRSAYGMENEGNKLRIKCRRNMYRRKFSDDTSFLFRLKRCPSLGTHLLHVWGSITQQGPRESSSCSASRRLVSLVCLMFGWLMLTSYSAALVSRLTVRKTEPPPFSSLQEAATRRKHVICTRVNDFAYSTLFKARTSDAHIMPKWVGIVNAPPCVSEPRSSDDIQRTICHKEAVTLETASIMSAILQNQLPCIATKMNKEKYAYVYISLLVRKGFPFKRLLNAYLLKLHTGGLIKILQQRYLQRTLQLKEPKYSLQITFQHIESILQLYGLSILLSMVILCLEKTLQDRFNTAAYSRRRPGFELDH